MEVTPEDLTCLCTLAQAAGELVMQVYDCAAQGWNKPDASPLTEADLQADASICAGLARAFPGVRVLSEESGSRGGAGDAVFFLVDPLDGTREFLKRNGEFTVNIALIVNGAPVAGVVLAPALAECYFAARGLGSWKSAAGVRTPLQVRPYDAAKPLRVVGSRSHGTDAMGARLGALAVPHVFTASGSSLKFCRVAQGEADIYPRFGSTSQWDTAAAQCVLEVAGGCVVDLQGQSLAYGCEKPLTNPAFLAMGDRSVFSYFRPDGDTAAPAGE